jgi:hypothetical protein
MSAWVIRERECVHRSSKVEGEFYQGTAYVERLQRLPAHEALKTSRNVPPFFWADAEQIIVWLCQDCARAIGFQPQPETTHA